MDEQQEQQQVVEQQPQITAEEIRSAIDSALQPQAESLNEISQDLQGVRVVLEKSNEDETEEEPQEELTYTVLIDQSQVQTAKSAVQTLSTLSLMLVIAISIMCGLQLWTILSRSWSRV